MSRVTMIVRVEQYGMVPVEFIRCDQCQKEQPLQGLIGWYSIEIIGADTSTYGELSMSGEYCSDLCLAERLQQRRRV
jgi:hypothetical protein